MTTQPGTIPAPPHRGRSLLLLLGAGMFLIGLSALNLWWVADDTLVAHHTEAGRLFRVQIHAVLSAAGTLLVWGALRLPHSLSPRQPSMVIGLVWLVLVGLATATPPTRSQDIYKVLLLTRAYVQEGKNPYGTTPADLASDPWAQPLRAWRQTALPRGPLEVLLIAPFVRGTDSVRTALLGVKMLGVFSLLATGVLLRAALRAKHVSPDEQWRRLAFLAWNPFLFQMVVVDAHTDLLTGLVLLFGYRFITTGRFTPSFVTLMVGGLLKYVSWPFALIPLWLGWNSRATRRNRWIVLGVATSMAFATLVVFHSPAGSFLTGGARAYLRGFSPYPLLGTAVLLWGLHLPVRIVLVVGGLGALGVLAYALRRRDVVGAFTQPVLSFLALGAPAFLPWYALWILPLLSLRWPLGMFAVGTSLLLLTPDVIRPFPLSVCIAGVAVAWGAIRVRSRLLAPKV